MPNTLLGIAFALAIGSGFAGAAELSVPKVSEISRIGPGDRVDRQDALTSTFIVKTRAHATLGEGYVIVTDQTDPAFVAPLMRLAEFHHGAVVRLGNLRELGVSAEARGVLAAKLKAVKPRYVALAPKTEDFTEGTLLGFWVVLTGLSHDQRLPVFPGILVAPDAASFASLIDRSIVYRPKAAADVRPFVIGQVVNPSPNGMRSLQKIGVLRNYFGEHGWTTHSLVVLEYSAVRTGVKVAPAENQWQVAMQVRGRPVGAVPEAARPALDAASLLVVFGHGSPGTAASLADGAFQPVPMRDKVVLSGDCFSAFPAKPDFPPEQWKAGRQVPESFAFHAVGNGAIVVFAHLHENSGFPHLFPVLEGWMNGMTVGEGYQRLINAVMDMRRITPRDLGTFGGVAIDRANAVLYGVIGDPALQPFKL